MLVLGTDNFQELSIYFKLHQIHFQVSFHCYYHCSCGAASKLEWLRRWSSRSQDLHHSVCTPPFAPSLDRIADTFQLRLLPNKHRLLEPNCSSPKASPQSWEAQRPSWTRGCNANYIRHAELLRTLTRSDPENCDGIGHISEAAQPTKTSSISPERLGSPPSTATISSWYSGRVSKFNFPERVTSPVVVSIAKSS